MEGLNCLTSEAILSPEPLQQNISLQKTPSGLCPGTGVGVFFVDGTFWASPGPQFPHLLSLGVPSSKAMLITPTRTLTLLSHLLTPDVCSPQDCCHLGPAPKLRAHLHPPGSFPTHLPPVADKTNCQGNIHFKSGAWGSQMWHSAWQAKILKQGIEDSKHKGKD